MAPEQIPMAGGATPWYRKIPWWGWGIGAGVFGGLGLYLYKKRSTSSSSSTGSTSSSSSDCVCSDGSTATNGVCDDGSQPSCSGDVGYLVGGDDSDESGALLEAVDQLSAGSSSSASSSTATAGSLKEGSKYGSGYYLRGSATPSGYTFLTPADLRQLEKVGSNIPFYFAPTSNAKTLTQMGTANLLPGTPLYATTSDLNAAKKASTKASGSSSSTSSSGSGSSKKPTNPPPKKSTTSKIKGTVAGGTATGLSTKKTRTTTRKKAA